MAKNGFDTSFNFGANVKRGKNPSRRAVANAGKGRRTGPRTKSSAYWSGLRTGLVS